MTRGPFLTYGFDPQTSANLNRLIRKLLASYPHGFPDGRGRRTHLSHTNKDKLQLALIHAVGYAAIFASSGPLPNRKQGRGRPPDNAYFLFIDDIVRACEGCGLKPGLRYVEDTESLPVKVFIELAPLLWGRVKAPRRLFERWQRNRTGLVRKKII